MLLHVGYHKTATTWLQQNLFFAPGSETFHAFTPDVGRPRALTERFLLAPDGGMLSAFDDNRAEIRAAVASAHEATQDLPGTPVLSDERLSGNPHSGGFDAERIARALREHLPDAEVLIVVREQKSLTLSCYFQYLSIGGTRSLQNYAQDRYDRRVPGFALANLDFLPLVERYRELWGPERVTVLPYELFAESPRRFLDRLEHVVGHKIEVPHATTESRENANRRPGAAYSLRWLNRFRCCSSVNDFSPWSTPWTSALAEVAFRALAKLHLTASDGRVMRRLQAEIHAKIGDRFRASNAQLGELYGLDLARYGYC